MVSTSTHQVSPDIPSRKQCIVEGCQARVTPSMRHNHMSLHAKGALPGEIPSAWLMERSLFICPNCYQLVSCSHRASHPGRCNQSSIINALHLPTHPASTHDLPTFEQVCQLNHPTLRFIPSKVRPAFARALPLALREVVLKNTEESWLKLIMLPKCVLPSIAHRGTHVPHMPIKSLCNMWLSNDLSTLWAMALNHTIIPPPRLTPIHLTPIERESIRQYPLVVQA